jgi:hypothetical protein
VKRNNPPRELPSLPDDVRKTVERIDKDLDRCRTEIVALERLRRDLVNHFREPKLVHVVPLNGDQPIAIGGPELQLAPTRKQALIRFLKEHGARTRKELVEQTGLPRGTIDYLLMEKDIFGKRADGRWEVREQNKISG